MVEITSHDAFILEAAKIERDVRLTDLTPAEITAIVEAVSNAALAQGEAGYRLVPVEPTEAMLRTGVGYCDMTFPDGAGENSPKGWEAEIRMIWSAMLVAAPDLPRLGRGEADV